MSTNWCERRAPRPASRRPPWTLDLEAFRALLGRLTPDDDRAGSEYELLRQKLIVYFAGRGDRDPERSADETLDRVSRRLRDGEEIADVERYAHGVARRVLSEAVKRRGRHQRLLGRMPKIAERNPSKPAQITLDCLSRCAQELRPSDWSLVLDYYASNGRERQIERQELAKRLGITLTALRLRVFRIRAALDDCVRRCCAERDGIKVSRST